MASKVKIKAKGKWVDGLRPDTPIVEAARAFLSVRMEGVAELLPLAQAQSEEDVEYIHQLRVRTRRADAALRTFEQCIKPQPYAKMRKRLRRIRRAAGQARICDVHGIIFDEYRATCPDAQQKAAKYVVKRNAADRAEAQRAIDSVARRYPPQKLTASIEKLLRGLRQTDDGLTLLDIANRTLPALLDTVRATASADMSVYENMHRLRLEGKRLRYAMEIFAPCFAPELRRDCYPLVQQMQDHLGSINDSHEIITRLGEWAAEADRASPADELIDGLAQIESSFRGRLDEQCSQFLDFWSQFGIDGLLGGLEDLLAREPVA